MESFSKRHGTKVVKFSLYLIGAATSIFPWYVWMITIPLAAGMIVLLDEEN